MASEENDERPGFTDLLTELERQRCRDRSGRGAAAAGRPSGQRCSGSQEAVEASYRALAGSDAASQLETVAVLEEVAQAQPVAVAAGQVSGKARRAAATRRCSSFSRAGRWRSSPGWTARRRYQLADLQQAIRVLAWGTSITTHGAAGAALFVRPGDAIAAWQQAKDALGAGRCGADHHQQRLGRARPQQADRRPADAAAGAQAGQSFGRHDLRRRNARLSGDRAVAAEARRHADHRLIASRAPCSTNSIGASSISGPGDALRCRVDFETSYGPDHEVLAERYRIVEILEVLPASRAERSRRRPRPRACGGAQPAEELEPRVLSRRSRPEICCAATYACQRR